MTAWAPDRQADDERVFPLPALLPALWKRGEVASCCALASSEPVRAGGERGRADDIAVERAPSPMLRVVRGGGRIVRGGGDGDGDGDGDEAADDDTDGDGDRDDGGDNDDDDDDDDDDRSLAWRRAPTLQKWAASHVRQCAYLCTLELERCT
jgi:hypothetical protein